MGFDLHSYRFGSGRYIQEKGVLQRLGSEVKRFGAKAYIIGGLNALTAVSGMWEAGFDEAGIPFEKEVYSGFTSYNKVDLLCECVKKSGADVMVGIGGGKIMDLVKVTAAKMSLPVITVPTSCATCAAYSPLSVMYTDEGECVGYEHFDYEVNEVLVDLDVMAKQPPRLIAAGIMDAMAKYIEISNGLAEIAFEDTPADKYFAYKTAKEIYDILEKHGPDVYKDVSAGVCTKLLSDVVFINIALTGIVSAMMRAVGQTAIAHKLYEIVRSKYFRQSKGYLHGELVATGLISQLIYNGNEKGVEPLKTFMRIMEMPLKLSDMGLSKEDCTGVIFEELRETEFVKDDDRQNTKLRKALSEIV